MKKTCTLIFTLFAALMLFAGCGGPKQEADESVKAIYDLYILGSSSGVSKLGMSDDEIEEALTLYDETLKNTIQSNLQSTGITVDEALIDDVCDARKTALKKMKVECESVSSDKTKSVVKLSTTYFDEVTLDTDAATDAAADAENSGIEDLDEMMTFIGEAYLKNLVEAYNNVAPSEDVKELTVNCTIVDNVWMPEDMNGFGTELGKAVSGQ